MEKKKKPTLIITIGISGSGKSRWVKTRSEDVVSTDSIRKSLTGNVSDQSNNAKVWAIAFKRLFKNAMKGVDTILDSTMCDINKYNILVKTFRRVFDIKHKIFPSDVDTSFKRIQHDMNEKIDRADVPLSVLNRQKEGFNKVVSFIQNKDNLEEHIISFIQEIKK